MPSQTGRIHKKVNTSGIKKVKRVRKHSTHTRGLSKQDSKTKTKANKSLKACAADKLKYMATAPSRTLKWFGRHWTATTMGILQTFAVTVLVISLIILIRDVKDAFGQVFGRLGEAAKSAKLSIVYKISDASQAYVFRNPVTSWSRIRALVNTIPLGEKGEAWRDIDVTRLRLLKYLDTHFIDVTEPAIAIVLSNVAYNIQKALDNPPFKFDPEMVTALQGYRDIFVNRLAKAWVK